MAVEVKSCTRSEYSKRMKGTGGGDVGGGGRGQLEELPGETEG